MCADIKCVVYFKTALFSVSSNLQILIISMGGGCYLSFLLSFKKLPLRIVVTLLEVIFYYVGVSCCVIMN